MTGLCGWFSRDPPALPIEQMAAPLARFGQSPLRTATHSAGAVALAGGLDCASLYHENGLLIAHWGERVDALARLWRSHGPKGCSALSGQFAFAILDERKGEALLALDRSATRPLFYQLVGHTLVFASSTAALVQHPGVGRDVDPQSLYNCLHFEMLPGPATMYRRPVRLGPGEFVHLHDGRLDRGRYWQLQFHEDPAPEITGLKGEFVDTLRTAVQASLGQQKVGVLMSGGAGSAALAALLGTVTGGPVPTYAIGCEAAGRSHLERIRVVARALCTDHHERYLTASEVADAIPQLAAVFDQPCGDPGALAAFYCARMAREDGVLRLLGGQGGAELFGGRARPPASSSQDAPLPSAVRQLLAGPLLARLARGMRRGPLKRVQGHDVDPDLALRPRGLPDGSLLSMDSPASVFEPSFLALVDTTVPESMVNQAWLKERAFCQVNRLMGLDLQYRLPCQGLPQLIKACELAGVDAAFPFLNDAVVAFAARLAPCHKLDQVRLRGFFSDALRGTVPPAIAAGWGSGFSLPFGHWLQTDARLKGIAFDSLSDLRRRRIVRADFIDSLLTHRLAEHPGRHGRSVWVLMMLEQWFVQHGVQGVEPHVRRRSQHVRITSRQLS